MNLYRITLRRLRHEHAIPNVLVVLPVRMPECSTAYEVIQDVERRWPAWSVSGIEKVGAA